jgi:hypothetical protein
MACLLLMAILTMNALAVRAEDSKSFATAAPAERNSSMSNHGVTRDLFDGWEQVWREGRFDSAPGCVADRYTRHDEGGERTVTRDAYAAEIAEIRQERPDIRDRQQNWRTA